MSDMDHEVRSARMLGCEISTNPLDPLEPILKMCEYHHPDEDMSILASLPARRQPAFVATA